MFTYKNKHTPVPRHKKHERVTSDATSRFASPEEMAEIIAKYGPPKKPLGKRKGSWPPKAKKKGGDAA